MARSYSISLKGIIISSLFLFVFTSQGQNVDRKLVLVEKWTGTWCTYCPSAAMGVHDLVDSGTKVVVVSYHSGDSYEIPEGLERSKITSKFLVDGGSLPTAQFDAKVRTGGVIKDTSVSPPKMISAYPIYRPIYDSLIVQKTPVSITLSKRKGTTYKECIVTASIRLENQDYTGKNNMQLLAVLTESHIPVAWKNQNSIEFAARSMYNGNKGTMVQLNSEGEAEIEFSMSLEPMWETLNCEIVCWLQDTANLQVLESAHIAVLNEKITNLETPLNFDAQTLKGTLSAQVSWNKPLPNSRYTVVGYNILQKGKLVNKEGLITDTFYNTPKLNLGENCLSIQTIYDCMSILSDTVCITINTLPVPTNLDTSIQQTKDFALIDLSWDAPLGYEAGSENASALKAYYIYRAGKKIAEVISPIQSYKDTILYKGNYTYTISALYNNMNIETESSKSEGISVDITLGGVDIEHISETKFELYPNPCRGSYINIEGNGTRYEIYSLNGSIVLSGKIGNNRIDVSTLGNGMYIVKIDRSYRKLTILR